jgi:glycosyltransferase involved in cell wall biosynthesis
MAAGTGAMPNDPVMPHISSATSRAHSDARAMRLYDVRELGDIIYEARGGGDAQLAVIIPLYNYAGSILEALGSVVEQDLSAFSLVVIDDCSTDEGGKEAVRFLEQHSSRFTESRLVRHHRNQGLSMARNSGIAWSGAPYLFMLDADNRLRPPALSRLLEAVQYSGAAFAYSQLRMFGDEEGIGIADVWEPERLAVNNYIDAMALIRRDALLAAGGYGVLADDHGLEDWDLWCRFAELGFEGVFVPELMCDYRIHSASMIRTRTLSHILDLNAELALRHPSLFNRRKPGVEPVSEGV